MGIGVALVAGPGTGWAGGPSPDPGGHEHAIVKVPPPGSRYLGIHEETILSAPEGGWRPSPIAETARGMGAEMLRFTINWNHAEPSQDEWDAQAWATYKAAYDAIIANGMVPMIGVSTAPPWARDFGGPALCLGRTRGCEYPPRPSMYGEWAEFLQEILRRFPQTKAIEIWNEPNLQGFWKPYPQPERYASLVIAAYDAIKAVQPRVKVLAGAMAGADFDRYDALGQLVHMSMRNFLTKAYAAGLAGHMDGISFHQAGQQIRYGKDSELGDAFLAVRDTRRRHDIRRTPIWITEFSLSTSDGPRVTPKVQADGLLRAYRKIITMPDVRGFIIHKLRNRIEFDSDHNEYGVGILAWHDPILPKPAYCAFAGRFRRQAPALDCRGVRESRVSRCTRKLVRLRSELDNSAKDDGGVLARRYRRLTIRCVPCERKEARVRRALAGAGGSRARRLRAKLDTVRERCAPCERKLVRLQRRSDQVLITLLLDLLNQHERTRRECR